MTPLQTVFILATFVAHVVTVTIYPLDEEDDAYESALEEEGYKSDAAECDEEEERDEFESSVGKRKMSDDDNDGIKKVKTR